MDDMMFSCDDHLDLRAVPVDLWQSRVPKDIATGPPGWSPATVRRPGCATDRVLGASGAPLANLSAIGRAGLEDDGFRASTTKLRLEDMDRDGVWASVIYGPVPLTLSIPEPDLQDACYAAWNDWAVEEFNAAAPDRLCMLAFLPSHSPEAAVAELERCAADRPPGGAHRRLRLRSRRSGVGPAVGGRRCHRPADQLPHQGRIVAAAQLPDGIVEVGRIRHVAAAPARRDARHHGVLRRTRTPSRLHARARRGRCRLAPVLPRPDGHGVGEPSGVIDYAPSIPPSELFRRQVIATFEEEKLADQFIPYLGADSCMWASDYPHTDSTFPESRRAIEETLGSLPAEDRRKITALNCKKLYRFEHAD